MFGKKLTKENEQQIWQWYSSFRNPGAKQSFQVAHLQIVSGSTKMAIVNRAAELGLNALRDEILEGVSYDS